MISVNVKTKLFHRRQQRGEIVIKGRWQLNCTPAKKLECAQLVHAMNILNTEYSAQRNAAAVQCPSSFRGYPTEKEGIENDVPPDLNIFSIHISSHSPLRSCSRNCPPKGPSQYCWMTWNWRPPACHRVIPRVGELASNQSVSSRSITHALPLGKYMITMIL